MAEVTTHIGILYVELFIASSQSLKDKRGVLEKLKSRTRSRFNVSISELDDHDKWQRATLGICMIAGEKRFLDSSLEKVLGFIDQYHAVDISNHSVEFI